jgi:phosphatidylserine decarboxylase
MNQSYATRWEKFKGLVFQFFPHHLISRITFWATRQSLPFTSSLINAFINYFKVDMRDALNEEIDHYKTFNAFFTRELKPDARPVDDADQAIVSPCDGRISQFGPIDDHHLIQAKGKTFTLNEFLTPSCQSTHAFIDGSFCTIYLSPRDYHRVHMPCDGKLMEMIYVPGRLFSVAPYAPKTIDKLFARNERVVSIFKCKEGYMASVMVGAVNVAAIEMVWEGLITPPHLSTAVHYEYKDKNITLNKGDQMGTFNMGSTVVLLFSKDTMTFNDTLYNHKPVKMGQRLGLNNN